MHRSTIGIYIIYIYVFYYLIFKYIHILQEMIAVHFWVEQIALFIP